MLERVIEERARGNPDAASAIRSEIVRLVGEDFAQMRQVGINAGRTYHARLRVYYPGQTGTTTILLT